MTHRDMTLICVAMMVISCGGFALMLLIPPGPPMYLFAAAQIVVGLVVVWILGKHMERISL